MKTESNNIYFIINSEELKREVAWEWRDQKKQFFQTWVPTEADIVLIDELTPDERALVKAEIMHELEPELREERLRRNKKAMEKRARERRGPNIERWGACVAPPIEERRNK